MLIHAFLTDGLVSWAELYLDSLKAVQGEDIPVVFDTRDLCQSDMDRLAARYGRLTIRNQPLDMAALSALSGIDVDQLRVWKHEVEHQVTTNENFRWKLLMSVEQRYRSLGPLVADAIAQGEDIILHSDIDLYFRRSLDRLFEIIRENDISAYFRPAESPPQARIWGGLIGLNLTPNCQAVIQDWMARIDGTPFADKIRGFGQLSLFQTYQARADACRWGNLSADPRAPVVAKTNNATGEVTGDIAIGNSNRGINRKDTSLASFREDFTARRRAEDAVAPARIPDRVFDRHAPSPHYHVLWQMYQQMHDQGYAKANADQASAQKAFPGKKTLEHAGDIAALCRQYQARHLLDYGAGKGGHYREDLRFRAPDGTVHQGLKSVWGVDSVQLWDPGLDTALDADAVFDGVLCVDVLEHCFLADIPWIVDELFTRARSFVFANVACNPTRGRLPNGEDMHVTLRPPEWWSGLFTATAARHPGCDYVLVCSIWTPDTAKQRKVFRRDRFETSADTTTRMSR